MSKALINSCEKKVGGHKAHVVEHKFELLGDTL